MFLVIYRTFTSGLDVSMLCSYVVMNVVVVVYGYMGMADGSGCEVIDIKRVGRYI